jgi:hypothetical protein
MKQERPGMRLSQIIWPVAAMGCLLVVAIVLPAYVSASSADISLIDRLLNLLTVLISFGLAVLLYVRRRGHAIALTLSYFLLGWGVGLGGPAEALVFTYPKLGSVYPVFTTLVLGLLLTTFLVLFPNGQPEPRWARWLIVISALLLVGRALYLLLRPAPNEAIDSWIDQNIYTPTIVALLTSIWRYFKRATLSERRQMRWALLGVGLFFVVAWLAVTVIPLSLRGSAWFLAVNMMPIFFTIAILRGKLWDVDLIIRRTLIYSIITALLTGVYFGSVVLMQSLFRALTGQQSTLAVVISTLVIAALFTPLRNRVQRFVDQRFFRQKYDAQRTLEAFSETMRDEVNLDRMTVELVETVEATMQPEHVGLWLAFEPHRWSGEQ